MRLEGQQLWDFLIGTTNRRSGGHIYKSRYRARARKAAYPAEHVTGVAHDPYGTVFTTWTSVLVYPHHGGNCRRARDAKVFV